MPVTREYTDHFSMDISPSGGTITLEFHVLWADIDDVLAELFPPTAGGSIGANELDPYLSRYRAQKVSVDKIANKAALKNDIVADPNDFIPRFEKASITVTYSNSEAQSPADQDEADADGDPVPFLSHTWSTGTELVEQETSGAIFTPGGNVKANTPVSQVITMIQHSIEWPRVVSPPFASIRALHGRVNQSTMDFATGSILPETLLLLGASPHRDYMSNGEKAWSLGYQFSERRVEIVAGLSVDPAYVYAELGGGTDPYTVYTPGDPVKYGGWNHFYDSITNKGFARLHKSPPGNVSVTWVGDTSGTLVTDLSAGYYGAYEEATAIYKKGDMSLLFQQV